MRRCSTAAAVSDLVVLLRFSGVAHVNWDMRFLDLVSGLPLLAASAIVSVCDRVLQAGALFLTVNIVWACRRLRALCFTNSLLLGGKSCGSILVVLSTLGTAVGGTLGTCGMSLTILLVNGFFLFGVSVVCTLGDAWVCSLFFIFFSVSFINCFNSSDPSLLPMFLIALLKSAMAAIILSAWVIAGLFGMIADRKSVVMIYSG